MYKEAKMIMFQNYLIFFNKIYETNQPHESLTTPSSHETT